MKKPAQNPFPIHILAVLAAIVLISAQTVKVGAVTCDSSELSPCASAITFGTTPTMQCCAKLTEQQPCFCQYASDPNNAQYINSANVKKTAAYCNVPAPKCAPPPSP
ncbi:hypothetical protein MLD38_033815 [Melastoma candidum]|uniref:Uncharacterized protein n=1 Tax=Melastoma candidum TaxID=119954 RepID=A0ACB9MAK6_9MYRT|nr:hypothetical protein MLD38_033815 [Melastoma candidum]